MLRQRLRTRRPPVADVVLKALVTLAALALAFYGAMTILLAVKVSPHTVNAISAYHTIYHSLASVTVHQITGTVRAITAGAGVVTFVIFAFLAWRAFPRPYLARSDLELDSHGGRGSTVVAPRAIERAAEIAALEHPLVTHAASRYATDDLNLAVSVRRASALDETLEAVRERVTDALAEHQLPRQPVHVTLTGFDPTNRRELH